MANSIQEHFADLPDPRRTQGTRHHGRVETRRVWVTDQLDDWLDAGQRERWPGLRSVAVVEATRDVPLKPTSTERRYFISSLAGTDAARMARIIRGHWSVENQLHWVLDVSFAENQARQRKDHSAENFSRLRRIALNLLRRETTRKRGIKGKRLNSPWRNPLDVRGRPR